VHISSNLTILFGIFYLMSLPQILRETTWHGMGSKPISDKDLTPKSPTLSNVYSIRCAQIFRKKGQKYDKYIPYLLLYL